MASQAATYFGPEALGYVNSITQAREVELATGAWIDSTRLYTYPESVYPGLPDGSGMDLFKGYALKDPTEGDVYVFSMNTDVLQIYPRGNKNFQFISGPKGYRPKFLSEFAQKPVNKFRAFGMPLCICNERVVVSYSGEMKGAEHKQYYQSSSLLMFDPSIGKFTSRLLLKPDLRWNYGAIDCERRLLYIIDQNFEREGAAIYRVDFSDSPFFL